MSVTRMCGHGRLHFGRSRKVFYGSLCAASLVGVGAGTAVGQAVDASVEADVEWRWYGADIGANRFSPLRQIDSSNVERLQMAWRWSARNFGQTPPTLMQVSPLVVNGIMYTTAGNERDVIAIDAATGQTLWTWRPTGELTRWSDIIEPVARRSGRGVSYWTDGSGDERIFVVMPSYMLVALDAMTGRQVEAFGADGVVDLAANLRWEERPGLAREGRVANTSPPAIVGNVLIASVSMHTGSTPNLAGASINEVWPMNIPGDVVAYDVRNGDVLWRFNTIPRGDEPGAETWLKADPTLWDVELNQWAIENPQLRERSWMYSGNAGFWAPATADPELGYFYVATETATSDYFGGYRPGNNLYANSIIALNAETGELAWHFQMTHHELWDYDNGNAPMLIDIVVEGQPIKALAQISKQAFVFVLNRETGEPVWPIEERPVPASDIPGEWTSPTQPFPTKPAPYDQQGMTEDDLIDFTPELRAEALRIAGSYRLGSLYQPPSVVNASDGTMGTLSMPAGGGANTWEGGAYDPENQILFIPSAKSLARWQMIEGAVGTGVRYHNTRGQESVGPATNIGGLPIFKPPYGRITAIDMSTGDRLWMVPHGNTPDFIANHPMLQGVDLPNTGAPTKSTGVLATGSLLFAGEGGGNPVLRAFDKFTGATIAEIELPGPTTGFPITYSVNGTQFIAVAVRVAGSVEIVALAIPG